jgi:hypothetical protein
MENPNLNSQDDDTFLYLGSYSRLLQPKAELPEQGLPPLPPTSRSWYASFHPPRLTTGTGRSRHSSARPSSGCARSLNFEGGTNRQGLRTSHEGTTPWIGGGRQFIGSADQGLKMNVVGCGRERT